MSTLVERLLCDNVKTLNPYESARRLFSGGQDWLNANESPFTNPYSLDDGTLNRYPDCQPDEVIDAYASYANLTPKQVITTRGADEGIELLIRAFCTPGQDKVLICPPTYGMYAISAETFNVGVESAPLNEDFSLNTEAMRACVGQVKLVFICSPNNPTGTVVAPGDIESVLEAFADTALVVVDEAYIEFSADNSWASRLADYPNLVILRTLSKAFALAGIRCGFTLASEDIVQALMKVIAPYPVPAPVAQIAAQALSSAGLNKMRDQVENLQQEKQRLAAHLSDVSQVVPVGEDGANFLLFRCQDKDALMAYLVKEGVLIRDQSKQVQLSACLRITVGTPEQNDRVCDLIARFYQTQDPKA